MGLRSDYYEWRIRKLEDANMDLRLENGRLRNKLALSNHLLREKNDLIAIMMHGR